MAVRRQRAPDAAPRRGAPTAAASLLALVALVALAIPAGAAGSATVSLTPARLALGEVAQLTFELTREDLGSFHFEPRFELDNFEVVGGPARRDSMTWTNGDLKRTFALTWYLAPRRAGKARVHDVKVITSEQQLPLADQEAWVDAAAPPGSAGNPGGGMPGESAPNASADPFDLLLRDLVPRPQEPPRPVSEPQILLRAELTPAQPWAGQQLTYTLYLLAERRDPGEGRVAVETIFPRLVPQFRGFWSQEIPLPESGRAEVVELDGKLWFRQPILQRALFPYEPGHRTIEAAQADLQVVYFRPVGLGFGEEPIRPAALPRTSNALTVDVRPLPPPPPDFHGGVGQLRASATVSPGRVSAGEGVELTAELTGSGNLSGLPDPRLPPMPGIQTSPPQEFSQRRVEGTRVISTRRWLWTIIPQGQGSWQIPPLEWVVFDPAAGTYQTVHTAPLQLRATAPPPRPAGSLRPAAASRAQALSGDGKPQRVLRWRSAGAAVGVVLLFGLAWPLSRFLRRDRHARRRLLDGISTALGQPQPRHAAGAAEEAWRRFLGERYQLPAEAPPTQWPGLLAARGLAPKMAGELVRLVDDLHYLRYAPQLASTDSLQRELLERSRRLARRLA